MSERPKNAAEASTLHDEGMLNVSDYLYVLRNEASRAADDLREAISYMADRLHSAQRTHDRLMLLADQSERAAEQMHETETNSA